jgi:hypothetical protein
MSGSAQCGISPTTISSRDGLFVAQIVALGTSTKPVVIDLQTRAYNTFGAEERGHVTARLTLSDALALHGVLSEVIAGLSDVPDHRQTSLWGSSRSRRRAA